MTHAFFARAASPRVFAHRGLVTPDEAAAGVAENSFTAVAAAHAAGAQFVELDCHLTRDGEVVVFHDASLERVTGDSRRVRDVTAAELREIMAERGGMVTLRELLEGFPTLRFNIDVKVPEVAVPVGRIVAPHADRVLIASFDDSSRRRALQAARAAGGDPATSSGRSLMARIVLSVAIGWGSRARALLASVDAVQIPLRMGPVRVFSPRLVRYAHAVGTEVHVWTINEPDDMLALVAAGADGIITDRADVALRVLAAPSWRRPTRPGGLGVGWENPRDHAGSDDPPRRRRYT